MAIIDLKFDHVSKRYKVRAERDESAASGNPILRKLQSLARRSQDFWALRDVTFEVERSEALGIIGHNGAGKSTILKLLSNITTPTSGEIAINGRLSALIEVGSGFHPELTGRENVYLSGSILGMRRREITEKLDQIVEFAGIKQFIDVPVKRYSSGMYVRLGFSIAAHLDPDVLLLDEVLAVGDAAFQAKCLQRITDLKHGGKTIVFVSHDLGAVERLCDRVLLMQRGEVVASGPAREVIAEYQRLAGSFTASQPPPVQAGINTRRVEIRSVTFRDSLGQDAPAFKTGGPLSVAVEYFAHERVEDAVFEVFFYAGDDELHCQLTTESAERRIDVEPGGGVVEFSCPELGLQPGIYHVDATVVQREPLEGIEWQYHCAMMRVDPGRIVRGNFYMPHEWAIKKEPVAGDAAPEGALGQIVSKI
ncbi:MAG: ABC transporter ATP-binding protein [Pyrinomonadaceae bacterium]|nr:ABC transporter ATP-binding protein [Pyrinomonadaceae bacterium]